MVPRRTISEIVTLYELEPELIGIFVEGRFDKFVLQSFFDRRPTVSVSEIQELEIPAVEGGNKGRVIRLSEEFVKNGGLEARVICVVDRDIDDFLDNVTTNDFLERTDFPCMENYFADDGSIVQFLKLWKGVALDADVLKACYDAAVMLFSFRLWQHSNAREHALLVPSKGFPDRASDFDFKVYVTKFVSAHGVRLNPDELALTLTSQTSSWMGDVRNFFNFHDFVELLLFLLKRVVGLKSDEAEFGDAYRVMFTPDVLRPFGLFNTLENRTAVTEQAWASARNNFEHQVCKRFAKQLGWVRSERPRDF